MQLASVIEPPPEESEVLDLLLPQLARFLAREVNGETIDREKCIPKAVRDGAARLGLFGLTIPTESGGSGLSLAAACKVVSEIARVDRSVAIMIGLHAGLGTQGLVQHGTAELRREWLPRLASGEAIASFAATEASAGSDLGSIRTVGAPVAGGLRIDGEKSYVTNGGFAGLFTVLVRTPGLGGERACSVVCVPRDLPGVQIGSEEEKLGIRGSSTVTVRFDGAVIPWTHVLGEAGRGIELTNGLLAWGRTLMSAGCVGTARAALDAAIEYVGSRRQFGRNVGEFGATRAHVAYMGARVHAMEAIVRSVAAMQARGESIETASTIAKVFTSDSAFEVCDRAIQLHGALGFLESTGVARQLRDCRITRIFEGANDVLLVRLGAARLATRAPLVRSGEEGVLDVLARRLDVCIEQLRARLGIAAIRKQVVLQRLARAEIALAVGRAIDRSTPLGHYAVARLAAEGHDAVASIGRAERDEEEASAIAELLYGA
jgi:alkylation response protein AidB-like acyl-CoA dehydrogenase